MNGGWGGAGGGWEHGVMAEFQIGVSEEEEREKENSVALTASFPCGEAGRRRPSRRYGPTGGVQRGDRELSTIQGLLKNLRLQRYCTHGSGTHRGWGIKRTIEGLLPSPDMSHHIIPGGLEAEARSLEPIRILNERELLEISSLCLPWVPAEGGGQV